MSIESFIIDGARSPIGTKNGQMVGVRSDDLTAQVIQGLMQRNANIPVETVEDVVVGCAFPEGPQGMLMARSISVLADLPIESGAKVVNRFCGSSMDSVHQLSQAILAGDIDAGIAAGVEDMFSVPMGGFNPSFHPDLYEKEFYIGMGDTGADADEISFRQYRCHFGNACYIDQQIRLSQTKVQHRSQGLAAGNGFGK